MTTISPNDSCLTSMRYEKAALVGALQLLIVLSGGGCLNSRSPQARYDQALTAFRHGNLREARRLAALKSGGDSGWQSRFQLLGAEVMLAEGKTEQALRC